MHEEMIEGVPDPEEIPDPDDLLTPEELDERRKKRRYVIYAVLGFLVIMIVLITAFVSSGSGEEEAVESTESNIPHPLVEMAKLKSVPLQGYDVSRPLIAIILLSPLLGISNFKSKFVTIEFLEVTSNITPLNLSVKSSAGNKFSS